MNIRDAYEDGQPCVPPSSPRSSLYRSTPFEHETTAALATITTLSPIAPPKHISSGLPRALSHASDAFDLVNRRKLDSWVSAGGHYYPMRGEHPDSVDSCKLELSFGKESSRTDAFLWARTWAEVYRLAADLVVVTPGLEKGAVAEWARANAFE